jgi:hypothetical protein
MRLISARIRGFGRLVDTRINLDAKVLAVVGPNEAGKTTLLKALAHVDSTQAVAAPQRSRALDVEDSLMVVSLEYVLNGDDHEALADLDLEEEPHSITVGRKAEGGNAIVTIRPYPTKARALLLDSSKTLSKALRANSLDSWIDRETTYADSQSDAARDYRAELTTVAEAVDTIIAGRTSDLSDHLLEIAKALLSATLETAKSESLRTALAEVISWAERENPEPSVRSRLWKRTPDVLLFDEPDRNIQSAYTLDDALVQDVPRALGNLAGMAGLDLAALLRFGQTGDIARRDTAITQANTRLDAIFTDAWKQARLSVRFSVDGQLLRVGLWEDGDNITVFDERSAGLRMFVALIAFLKVHGASRPPVLLIDEAESHLHIDAQADLVNMFATQEHAVKVIYTTHSPACLPQDLGCGIRSVVPRPDNQQVSDVKNSFWQGAAGYSPLMLAMGAAAAAFTPARCVVLTEGATEMILLPSLIRAATQDASLPYQIAPGLSEVPKDFYPKLDMEGAKVAYLLDGDEGGDDLEKGLLGAGVPKDLITRLSVAGVENLLDADAYRAALSALLGECNRGVAVPEIPQLGKASAGSWAKQIDNWVEGRALRAPSKVAVANWLIENGKALPSVEAAQELKSVHKALAKSLGL